MLNFVVTSITVTRCNGCRMLIQDDGRLDCRARGVNEESTRLSWNVLSYRLTTNHNQLLL